MINGVLQGYIGSFDVYVDDVIIYSRKKEEHAKHLSQVPQALSHEEL